MIKKQVSIKTYWIYRVIVPALLALAILTSVVVAMASFSIQQEAKRSRELAIQTMAILVVDPLLMGDHLEVAKRLSMLGKEYGLNVVVSDKDNVLIASYPTGVELNQNESWISINANDGRVIGYITGITAGHPRLITAVGRFLIVGLSAIVVVFAIATIFMLFTTRKILADLTALTLTESSGAIIQEIPSKVHFTETKRMFNVLLKQTEKLLGAEKNRAITELSHQVAHDIRSPLAALEVSLGEVKQLPESERIMIRSAINRIKDIANNLIEKNRELTTVSEAKANQDGLANVSVQDEPIATHLLSSHIEPIITEKRMQYRSKIGIQIDCNLENSYGLFAKVKATEFKRVLSNLINNSIEALGDRGTVTVSLTKGFDNEIKISVQDNGNGILPEILTKLGQRGETHGKTGGSGLGLYHAQTSAESWGGSLEIKSEIGKGTCVNITLPHAMAPDWFVLQLDLNTNSTVVILDDDTSIHQIWQGRFNALFADKNAINVLHMSIPEELAKWVHGNVSDNATFLIDYEYIGIKETGLDIIKSLDINKRSILVTSRYEEHHVMDGCKKLGIRLIPKGLTGFVPINIQASSKEADQLAAEIITQLQYILIDDDELVQNMWKLMAKKAGKSFLGFIAPTDFFKIIDKVPKSAFIYVDSSLGDGIKGEEVAKQLHELGFPNLYIASGYKRDHFSHLIFLKGVQGKEPPF